MNFTSELTPETAVTNMTSLEALIRKAEAQMQQTQNLLDSAIDKLPFAPPSARSELNAEICRLSANRLIDRATFNALSSAIAAATQDMQLIYTQPRSAMINGNLMSF